MRKEKVKGKKLSIKYTKEKFPKSEKKRVPNVKECIKYY